MKIGLFGFGKAGQAVANVLQEDPRFSLQWIARRSGDISSVSITDNTIPLIGLNSENIKSWLDNNPVDAIVDFSGKDSLALYGEEAKKRQIAIVSAISDYEEHHIKYARELGNDIRIICSPNITLGINFLMIFAKMLRRTAPFADVEIIEHHFKGKTEVSGTARKIASTIDVDGDKIISLRLGGIVGHHEVIFGFPYQTVRLIHDSIKREAFGTGAAFVLSELLTHKNGFYEFEDLLWHSFKK